MEAMPFMEAPDSGAATQALEDVEASKAKTGVVGVDQSPSMAPFNKVRCAGLAALGATHEQLVRKARRNHELQMSDSPTRVGKEMDPELRSRMLFLQRQSSLLRGRAQVAIAMDAVANGRPVLPHLPHLPPARLGADSRGGSPGEARDAAVRARQLNAAAFAAAAQQRAAAQQEQEQERGSTAGGAVAAAAAQSGACRGHSACEYSERLSMNVSFLLFLYLKASAEARPYTPSPPHASRTRAQSSHARVAQQSKNEKSAQSEPALAPASAEGPASEASPPAGRGGRGVSRRWSSILGARSPRSEESA